MVVYSVYRVSWDGGDVCEVEQTHQPAPTERLVLLSWLNGEEQRIADL